MGGLGMETSPLPQPNPKPSFASAFMEDSPVKFAIDDLPIPFVENGVVSVQISEESYLRGLQRCKNNLIGRVFVYPNSKPLKAHDLVHQLKGILPPLNNWTVAPLGKGFFMLQFQTLIDMQRVWALGSLKLQQGLLRLIKWTPNFSPSRYKNTFAQVWVKFWDLGFDFWEDQTLFEIANGVGTPLKIDPRTRNRTVGLYASILIDVDFSKPLQTHISVNRVGGEKVLVGVEYESVPDLCSCCGIIGHAASTCKSNPNLTQVEPGLHGDNIRGRKTERSKHARRRRTTSNRRPQLQMPNTSDVGKPQLEGATDVGIDIQKEPTTDASNANLGW
ncbi:uncharacterized protein LOC133716714 [Rosa rugosa]|uniref:uncharacterized protein LOC133716714 n=1 Tax=Rosa rugosa TaxID=74645 RepID=UPI002B40260C|nr:uncharacterized protein LOC133716714 [Rosa rugosa]